MEEGRTLTIEVDAQAAEILRAATRYAQARGETLGSYLRHTLPDAAVPAGASTVERQRKAWNAFAQGMTEWAKEHLPPGHIVDDSRDSIYD